MSKYKLLPQILKTVALLPFAFSTLAQEVDQAINKNAGEKIGGLEVIEVVAQKRVSTLQETPLAISAFNKSLLEEQGIEDALDIQFSVPNMLVSNNSDFNIRGVGNNAISTSSDPGTGVHYNGVYMASNNMQNEYYDLQSIEVLRGPQGTLYGRNTTAGVVNILTARPDDIFEASLSVEVASYNSIRTTGMVNIPLSDTVFQRFAFNTVSRDGYTDNVTESVGFDKVDGREQYSLRSSTAFEFTDNTDGFLFVQYFKEDSDRATQVGVLCKSDPLLGCNPDSIASEFPYSNFTDGSLRNALGFNAMLRDDFYNLNLDGSIRENPSDPRKVRTDVRPEIESDELLVSFELNHEFGDHVFTSVTAYHDSSYSHIQDFDNADGADAFLAPVSYYLPGGIVENTTRHSMVNTQESSSTQWSQEFRIASYLDGDFNYTVGAFYMDFEANNQADFYLPELSLFADLIGSGLTGAEKAFSFQTPEYTTTSWAIFSEGYYQINDELQLTVGVRYTEEEKEMKTRQVSPLGFPDYTVDDGAWEEFTGKIALSYAPELDFTDASLFFGSLSRGYKGGGINPGQTTPELVTFDPEYINSLEIGTKNTMFDRMFQANMTAFVYQYDGLQVGGILEDSGLFNTNVDADVKGVEFEFILAMYEGLKVNLNYSLLDSQISEDFFTAPDIAYSNSRGKVNIKGNSLPYAPEKSLQFGIQYTTELTEGWDITYRGQTFWQDDYWARLYNIPTDKLDSWQQTDVGITIKDQSETWSVELFVKNVEDDASLTALSVEGALIGRYRKPKYLEPRLIGLNVTYWFE